MYGVSRDKYEDWGSWPMMRGLVRPDVSWTVNFMVAPT